MTIDDNIKGLLLLLSISHLGGALGAFYWITYNLWWIFFFRIFAPLVTDPNAKLYYKNKVQKKTQTVVVPFKMTWKSPHEWMKHTLSEWREENVLCSIFTVEREHFTHICGQERARYPDTANTFSTTGYLITSIATCSPTTPITHLADRSGTYSIKWNALGDTFNRGLVKPKPPGNL